MKTILANSFIVVTLLALPAFGQANAGKIDDIVNAAVNASTSFCTVEGIDQTSGIMYCDGSKILSYNTSGEQFNDCLTYGVQLLMKKGMKVVSCSTARTQSSYTGATICALSR